MKWVNCQPIFFLCSFICQTICEGIQSVRHGARHRGTQRRWSASCLDPGEWARRPVSHVTGARRRPASKCCGLAGGGDSRPSALMGCAIRSAARVSFLRHSKLTTGQGVWGHDPVCLPLSWVHSESLLLPRGQLHTRSKLSLLRNRAKKNINESKDEIQEARRPGAFSE